MDPKQLIDALRERNWTQVQIARRIGVKQSTVSKISLGHVDDVMSKSYRALLSLYEEVIAAKVT